MRSEEGKRCAPVLAALGRHARDRVVRWRIEPDVFAIDEKGVLFRSLVVPAHLAGTQEVGVARLGADETSILEVAFEKRGLQRVGRAVTGFEEPQEVVLGGLSWCNRDKRKKEREGESHLNSLTPDFQFELSSRKTWLEHCILMGVGVRYRSAMRACENAVYTALGSSKEAIAQIFCEATFRIDAPRQLLPPKRD